MTCLDWFSVKVFESLLVLFEGVVSAICCSGILNLGQIWHWNLPASQEHRTKGAAGEATISPTGYPPKVPKNRSPPKTRYTRKGSRKWLPNRSQHLKVWRILGNHFWYISTLFCWMSFLFFRLFRDRFYYHFNDLFRVYRISLWN